MMNVATPVSWRARLAAVGAVVALLTAFGAQSAHATTGQKAAAPKIIYKGPVAVTQLFTSAAASYYIAKELGYYKAAGLDLQPVNFNGGTDTINAIRTMGIGFASTSAGILGISRGIDIRIVGGGFNTAGEQFIVPRNSPLRTIDDMKGRKTKIAVSRPGSNTEFEIYGIASRLGLSVGKGKDVELVYIGDINAAWTAAKQGLVDAAYSGPPVSTKLAVDGQARVWIKASTYFPLPNDLSFATSDFIKERPNVIRAWMRAQDRANKLIAEDPARAARAYARGAKISVPIAKSALAAYKSAYSQVIDKRGVQRLLRTMVAQRLLKSTDQINLNKVIRPGFAQVK